MHHPVQRLLPLGVGEAPHAIKVAYYRLRMDRTPPQNEMFNLCIVSEDRTAYLKMFETYTNSHSFVAPYMDRIVSVMIAPVENEWDMKHVDIERQALRDGDDVLDTTVQRYIPYYGAIETKCLFVPEEPKKIDYQEGIVAYTKQKRDTHKYTVGFLVGGAVLFQVTSGAHSAFAFVVGCTLGIVYQVLLQYEVDRVGKQMMFVNSASRMAILGLIAGVIMNGSQGMVPADIWIATTGFLMQKIALWIAFL